MKDPALQKLVRHLLLLGDNAGLKELVSLQKKDTGKQINK